MKLTANTAYLADLNSELTNVAIGTKWGTSEASVRRHKDKLATKTGAGVQGVEESSDGSKHLTGIRDRVLTLEDAREWIASTGDNPDDYTLSIKSIAYGIDMYSNKMSAVPKRKKEDVRENIDLPALYAAARHATPVAAPVTPERATVIVWADPQIGKTGRRGGTPELIERSNRVRTKLHALLTERKPSQIVVADGGDGFEGFESGGNPAFTNDLSLADQMDCYGTELFEFVNVAHGFAPVTVLGVTSNHTAWRCGKQNLGRPQDDLGLFMHRQVAKVTKAAHMAVEWVAPAPYDESVAHTILGTTIGMVHGNQFGPGGAINWWEKQSFGAQAVTAADVLITAHYHSFGAGVAGRNPANGRQRWWLGAPTLDNGSDWFRQTAGRDSDPGLLVFDVTPDGFDLGSLVIL